MDAVIRRFRVGFEGQMECDPREQRRQGALGVATAAQMRLSLSRAMRGVRGSVKIGGAFLRFDTAGHCLELASAK